jgi:hypothetical protein
MADVALKDLELLVQDGQRSQEFSGPRIKYATNHFVVII